MDIFKKIIQAGQNLLKSDLQNQLGVDKEFIELLRNYFELTSPVDSQMPVALLRYIIDDVDDGILLKLQRSVDAVSKLGYKGTWQETKDAIERRNKIFAHPQQEPPQIWYRWGHLSAAARAAAGGFQVSRPDGFPDWLTFLFIDAQQKRTWSLSALQEILAIEDMPRDLFVRPFIAGNNRHLFNWGQFGNSFRSTSGLLEYIQEHEALVKSILPTLDIDDRIYALNVIQGINLDCTALMDLLVDMAAGSSKTIREAALPLLKRQAEVARPIFEKLLREGDAGARNEAVKLMGQLYKSDCRPLLEEHLKSEKSERVRQSIQNLIASAQASAKAAAAPIDLPPLQVELGQLPLPPQLKEKLTDCFNIDYEANLRFYTQQLEQWKKPDRPKWVTEPKKPEPVTDSFLQSLYSFIENGGTPDINEFGKHWLRNAAAHSKLNEAIKIPGLKLTQFVRLLHALNLSRAQAVTGTRSCLWFTNSNHVQLFREAGNANFGLRELDAAFATIPGREPGIIGLSYLRYHGRWHSFWQGAPDTIWPIFAQQPQILQESLEGQFGYYSAEVRANVFRVLAMFPQVPGEFLPTLWELALGETKSERYLAQEALHAVPDQADRIIKALEDGKQTVRASAAEWLGKIGDKSAVKPLKAAFAREKSEVTKGAMMHALDLLGANIDEFLDRDKLLEEAKAAMAKKLPKGMEWLPLDGVPKMHWQDTGKQVDAKIVQWWIVQCIQQKSPSCGPLLRRYLSMCKPQDVLGLAKYALSIWIGRETAVLSVEDTAAKAKEQADQQWARYGTSTWYVDRYKGNKENLYKEIFNNIQKNTLYSAIEQKGLLALGCVAGDSDSVKLCEKYIRTYYGTKAAQCKCLIEVLSWIEHPLALQAMLSFANRFRTKSIKEMAQENVQAIADRKGWTIDELADRTIPDGGFARPVNDDNEPIGDEAILELDYGARQFQSRLNDELEPVIYVKGESKPIKALPAAGKNDDEEKAKESQKQFSDAKKVVKEVVKRQTERLYEAMCTQRSWKFADWKTYLACHPVVGRLCVRLVWSAYSAANGSEPKFLGCFRPLEDGSLTNENDESVTLADDATVVLSHSCNSKKELGEAWVKHLKDYDIKPLFQQFGRDPYVLPESKEKATEITDFQGHMLTTFKLRGKATKLGFVRGEVEDGGCFCLYRKSFSSLKLQAVIEFSGSYVPEEDIPAALTDLYFEQMPEGEQRSYSWNAVKVPLGKVPAVLLSECYNDIKQIAKEGSGFDPDWKKKGLW